MAKNSTFKRIKSVYWAFDKNANQWWSSKLGDFFISSVLWFVNGSFTVFNSAHPIIYGVLSYVAFLIVGHLIASSLNHFVVPALKNGVARLRRKLVVYLIPTISILLGALFICAGIILAVIETGHRLTRFQESLIKLQKTPEEVARLSSIDSYIKLNRYKNNLMTVNSIAPNISGLGTTLTLAYIDPGATTSSVSIKYWKQNLSQSIKPISRLAELDFPDIKITMGHPNFDKNPQTPAPKDAQIRELALLPEYRANWDRFSTANSSVLALQKRYQDEISRIEYELGMYSQQYLNRP